jgi:hypothetical protein
MIRLLITLLLSATLVAGPAQQVLLAVKTTGPTGDIISNLVSRWDMEDGSGSTVTDVAGSNDGTTTGSPTWGTGHNGTYSLTLDGSTQYVNCGSDSSLNPTSAITVAAWVKPSALSHAYSIIFGRSDGGGSVYYNLYVKSNGKIAVYMSSSLGGVSADGTGTAVLTTGNWWHVAFTYDSTDGLRVYVNGSEDTTAAANGTLSSITGTNYIAEDIVTSGRRFAGDVDEVRLYSRRLVANDIATLYAF